MSFEAHDAKNQRSGGESDEQVQSCSRQLTQMLGWHNDGVLSSAKVNAVFNCKWNRSTRTSHTYISHVHLTRTSHTHTQSKGGEQGATVDRRKQENKDGKWK